MLVLYVGRVASLHYGKFGQSVKTHLSPSDAPMCLRGVSLEFGGCDETLCCGGSGIARSVCSGYWPSSLGEHPCCLSNRPAFAESTGGTQHGLGPLAA